MEKKIIELKKNNIAQIKCGMCNYTGQGESGRSVLAQVLAWMGIILSPFITILYYVVTNKYQCPKCKSSLVAVKNKQGVFVEQSASKRLLAIIAWIFGIFMIVTIILGFIFYLMSVY